MEDDIMREATASSLMLPPRVVPSQRRRAPKVYTKEEWEMHKAVIERLYVVEKKKLEEVSEFLEDYGFYATARQYKRRIKDWGLDKNFKNYEMKAIIRKQQQRIAQGKKSVFEIRGRQVEPSKIERAEKRYANSGNFAAQHQSPVGATPPDLVCYTPSSGGLPEPDMRDNSISRTSHQSQAGIYWPASPVPVQSPPDLFSPHGLSMIRSVPGTPGTPYVTDILKLDTHDFTGESPAPIPATPPPSGQIFSAGAVGVDPDINYGSEWLGDNFLDPPNFDPAVWFPDGSSVDLLLNSSHGLTKQVSQDHQNMQREMAPLSRGRYREGEERRAKQELLRLEGLHGSEHPTTINIRLSLGGIFYDQGRFRAAELACRQAAAISQKHLGNDHELTFWTTNSLLWTLCRLGLTATAEEHYQSLRNRAVKVLGREHRTTLKISSCMSRVLYELQKWKEAESIGLECYEVFLRLYGPEHKSTVCTMEVLSIALRRLGQTEESERLIREAVRLRRVLNQNQPSLYLSIVSLAVIRATQGHLEESIELLQEVIQWQKSTLGSEHPDTLLGLDLFASILGSQGKLDEGKKITAEVLAGRIKVLGPGHPDTQYTRRQLASALTPTSSRS